MSAIKITNGVTRHPTFRFSEPINLDICDHEQVAIVGRNGAGKSILVDIIMGRYPLLRDEVQFDFHNPASNKAYDNIRYITFRDCYGDSDALYYQQRWNSQDAEITPLVRDILPEAADRDLQKTVFDVFGINEFLDKYIVSLSSGEMRKFQLARPLMSRPRVLIIDNPFIGLDAATRTELQLLLERLTKEFQIQIILVLSKTDDVPSFVTHVVRVENRVCLPKITRAEFLENQEKIPSRVLSAEAEARILQLPQRTQNTSEQIVRLSRVSIRYGERTILRELDWEVLRGEKWALSGSNGSGKSTLLSLICADNPQSYACDIALFGRKRGSGESIWDIKKNIGYVSPEMHRAYLKNIATIDIVASGLKDSIGLFQRPTAAERATCQWWLDVFCIAHLHERPFTQLSSGEQRLALLARAFVKDPDLLILDEPLHGLDLYNRRLAKDIIETFCRRPDKTMIMVTHYQEELPDCITHHLVLKKH